MTFKDGKYYCDICKDIESIPKGTGFSFPPNPLNIIHAHQSCYFQKQNESASILKTNDAKKRLKKVNVSLSDNQIDTLVEQNIKDAKELIDNAR